MTLRLDKLTAGYGGTIVLRDLTLAVPSGQVVALLGANGAGKTTALRVASGLLKPVRGDIVLDGEVITGRSTEAFAELGVTLVPEGRSVFTSMTVRENIALFAPPGETEDALETATAAFPKLGQRLDQIAGTMSGGEQQQLALSRAYVRPSSTVLLDEVSMGLAPMVVDEIYVALRDLADHGRSLLLVEQFAAKALAMADAVYVLAGGRIVFAGEPSEVDLERLSATYFGADA